MYSSSATPVVRPLIHQAIDRNDIQAIQSYIDSKLIDLNMLDEFGDTPLKIAVELHERGEERDEIAALLASARGRVDVNQSKNGDHLIHKAIKLNMPLFLNALIENPATNLNVEVSGVAPLQLAIDLGKDEIAASLASTIKRANINKINIAGQKPLHQAIIKGMPLLSKALIENPGTDLNAELSGVVPLQLTIDLSKDEIAASLAKTIQRVDLNKPNIAGQKPLHQALIKGMPLLSEALIENPGTDLNAELNGVAPLQLAIDLSKDEIAASLAKTIQRVDLNKPNIAGQRPLHQALIKGMPLLSEALIKNLSTDLNAVDHSSRMMPMDLVIAYDRDHEGALLSSTIQRVDLNKLSDSRTKPLNKALYKGNMPEFIESLIKNPGTDLNYVDDWGNTPLAIAHHNKDSVEFLLRAQYDRIDNSVTLAYHEVDLTGDA